MHFAALFTRTTLDAIARSLLMTLEPLEVEPADVLPSGTDVEARRFLQTDPRVNAFEAGRRFHRARILAELTWLNPTGGYDAVAGVALQSLLRHAKFASQVRGDEIASLLKHAFGSMFTEGISQRHHADIKSLDTELRTLLSGDTEISEDKERLARYASGRRPMVGFGYNPVFLSDRRENELKDLRVRLESLRSEVLDRLVRSSQDVSSPFRLGAVLEEGLLPPTLATHGDANEERHEIGIAWDGEQASYWGDTKDVSYGVRLTEPVSGSYLWAKEWPAEVESAWLRCGLSEPNPPICVQTASASQDRDTRVAKCRHLVVLAAQGLLKMSGPHETPSSTPSGQKKGSRRGVGPKRRLKGQFTDSELLLLKHLSNHHGYHSEGGCGTYDPVTVTDLARQSGIAKSWVSEFFSTYFGNHRTYKAFCSDKTKLYMKLKILNRDFVSPIQIDASYELLERRDSDED